MNNLRERGPRKTGLSRFRKIPVIRNGMSIWQGDITRLAVDAIVETQPIPQIAGFALSQCTPALTTAFHTFAGVQLRAECSRQMNQLREKIWQRL
jgi:hypothetical protein